MTRKVRLFQVRQTELAYLFSTTQKAGRDGAVHWIPKSIIEHISRGPEVSGEYRECVVTLPEWKADQIE